MKILVTGGNGLLGYHLVPLLLKERYEVVALSRGDNRTSIATSPQFNYYNADITHHSKVHDIVLKERPAVIVHAAAMTQVDECQLNQEQCEAINVHATASLLLDAEEIGARFIYLSTDFVFDGIEGNYKEEDHLNPISWYGFTKVQAESLVETSEIPWTIIRTCLVYGNTKEGTRTNIITWVKESLENNKPIKVVNDQWRTPTYVGDLARSVLLIIQQRATGVYHISGKDKLTPYQMALQTAELLGLSSANIEEVNANVFSQPAKRPPHTGFDIAKAQKELGFEPISFEEGLKAMLK